MRITDPRVQALLAAVRAFKLLPDGFTNRDLRHQLAAWPASRGHDQRPDHLRPAAAPRSRPHRAHPRTHRYQITPGGIRQALLLTRLSQRFLIPGMAHVAGPGPPADSTLRTAARAYEAAIDDLARHAGLAA